LIAKPRARRASRQGPPPRRLTACIATARSGKRCKAPPLRGKKYCALHTPGVASKLGQRGGRRRAIFDPAQLKEFSAPSSAQEFKTLLGTTAIELREGKLEARTANALSCLASGFLACLQHGELELRLRALEDLLTKARVG